MLSEDAETKMTGRPQSTRLTGISPKPFSFIVFRSEPLGKTADGSGRGVSMLMGA